jgi:hypothetical protein
MAVEPLRMEGTDDGVSALELGYPFADLHDFPGSVGQRDKPIAGWEETRHYQTIAEIERGPANADLNFARPRRPRFGAIEVKVIKTRGMVKPYGTHRKNLSLEILVSGRNHSIARQRHLVWRLTIVAPQLLSLFAVAAPVESARIKCNSLDLIGQN